VRRTLKSRGFTLVELMMVVAIIGILASLSVYGVGRYMASSKSAEALTNLAGISKSVNAAATRETMSAGLLAANEQTTNTGKSTGSTSGTGKGKGATVTFTVPGLCDAATSVPSSMSSVKARKYQPNPAAGADYSTGDGFTGWRCLKFSISSPQYYQYRYKTGGPPVEVTLPQGGNPQGLSADNSWSASAQGDLDGDDVTSWFVLNGYITDSRVVVQAPAIATQDPDE
jgi:prepilin-type N-terminal cleavage/methylation domain-containing protein